eukprot:TRINITY_DN238_c0_g1_i8.p1 TRINITY_DN238_c0_g1~~TRINITY_DN238_c0_g1_i8.p1  ORF type:complete len:180 (-),score=30.32 TRINITY_DN238_c0_g1_i8:19-558(-)
MIVYDVTDEESFKSVEMWVEEINKFATSGVCKLFIGNKIDLGSDRKVSTEQGAALAKHFGAKFVETSAKDSTNVLEAFKMMTQEMYNRSSKKGTMQATPNNGASSSFKSKSQGKKITLSSSETSESRSKQGCCCKIRAHLFNHLTSKYLTSPHRNSSHSLRGFGAVSYTHLTLPTNREV